MSGGPYSVEANIGLIVRCAIDLVGRTRHREYWTAGAAGIKRAQRGFRPGRGSWAGYAAVCIKNAIYAQIADECRQRRGEVAMDDCTATGLVDGMAVCSGTQRRDCDKALMVQNMRELSRAERHRLERWAGLTDGRPHSLQEIADSSGVCRVAMHYRVRQALGKVKK